MQQKPEGLPSLKKYIGDGVYVDTQGECLILTTENGIEITNVVILDIYVLKELREYLEWMKK